MDVLSNIGTLGSKPLKLPMEQNVHLSASSGTPLLDPTPYRRLIGKLMYLTITRPDLSYSIHILSQFLDRPSDLHFAAAHKVLRYVRAALDRVCFSLAHLLSLFVLIMIPTGGLVRILDDR